MDDEARRKRKVQFGAIAAILAVAAIAGLIAISQSGGDGDGGGETTSQAGGTGAAGEFEGIPQDGTVLGEAGAPVTVVEYGDLQCPICKEFSSKVTPSLVERARGGDVKLDFKQWVIIGPQSEDAAAAALAAAEQDRYWQFITAFYENQGPENEGYVTPQFLEQIATEAEVPDLEKWKADSAADKWKPQIKQIDTEATEIGFTGTPSVAVIGPGGRKDFTGNTVPDLSEIESAISEVQ